MAGQKGQVECERLRERWWGIGVRDTAQAKAEKRKCGLGAVISEWGREWNWGPGGCQFGPGPWIDLTDRHRCYQERFLLA